MRILVTGGAGFIGSHTVDGLVADGTHEVAVIDNLSAGKRDQLNPGARFYRADIRDAAEVGRIIASERPEVMVHFAAQMDVRRSVADPAFDAQVNLVGFLNLMEAGRQHGLRRVVFSSTGGAIYGEQDYFVAALITAWAYVHSTSAASISSPPPTITVNVTIFVERPRSIHSPAPSLTQMKLRFRPRSNKNKHQRDKVRRKMNHIPRPIWCRCCS